MRITAKTIYLILASTNVSLAYNWKIWPGAHEEQQTIAPSFQNEQISSISQFPQSAPTGLGSPSLIDSSQWTAAPNVSINSTSPQNTSPMQQSAFPNLSSQFQQPIGQSSGPLVKTHTINPQPSAQTRNSYSQTPSMQSINTPPHVSSPTILSQNPQSINQNQLQQQNTQQLTQSQQQSPAIGTQMALTGIAALTAFGNKNNQDTSSRVGLRNNTPTMDFSTTASRTVTKNFKCTKSEDVCQQEWDDLVQSIENNPQFQIIKKQLKCVPAATTMSSTATNE
ncbi:hypothetical protein [Candidatus Odyssella acanthamoebae]|uniref:Uncharacterized protein n=1 Tax=Candidatus Odyssella acanthamoebae TaxID=91604 RepID=A0A077B218_9PROT|nr:hypothetical protein [Candidatus Paracaedibacter acanthamoebae]AIK96990.1 hypothetical protein ID47_09985 [Candidatus Paracaedibacter acanthamoebae]